MGLIKPYQGNPSLTYSITYPTTPILVIKTPMFTAAQGRFGGRFSAFLVWRARCFVSGASLRHRRTTATAMCRAWSLREIQMGFWSSLFHLSKKLKSER